MAAQPTECLWKRGASRLDQTADLWDPSWREWTMSTHYVETVYIDGHWTNWIGGQGPSHHLHERKDSAVAEGRRLARSAGVRHVVEDFDDTR